MKLITELDEKTVDMLINRGAIKGGTYRAIKHFDLDCPQCGKATDHVIDGEWATGRKLASGYTPPKHELVQNHITRCQICGNYQAS